jgi:D-alanyl-D-alanine endopeptidase (penicillin-binding protein 7)
MALIITAFLTLLNGPATYADEESLSAARAALRNVYERRSDLRSLFNNETWLPAQSKKTSGIIDLEDWAIKYGYRESEELAWYGTAAAQEEVNTRRGSAVKNLTPSIQSDSALVAARLNLKKIYTKRGDLQALFAADSWLVRSLERTAGLKNLEDWAQRYGSDEHDELWWYGTTEARRVLNGASAIEISDPRSLAERDLARAPIKITTNTFRANSVTTESIFVLDDTTRRVLLAENADRLHPVASITKLMTAIVALASGQSLESQQTIESIDEVGGARLRVPAKTRMTYRDLMYSMLVGSANNAAHAIARTSAVSVENFIVKMNSQARIFGLSNTVFVDPSGLNVRNVSTAREIAALALEAWDYYELRRMCSTAEYEFMATDGLHTIKNTNDLLTDNTNSLIVLSGKTGYLNEAKWNLVVKMMNRQQKPIVVVVFGAENKTQLFREARLAADWVWENYQW